MPLSVPLALRRDPCAQCRKKNSLIVQDSRYEYRVTNWSAGLKKYIALPTRPVRWLSETRLAESDSDKYLFRR